MEKLLACINALSPQCREAFALRCDTSIGYLRKAISAGEKLNPVLCVAIERYTAGQVTCEELRPDLAEQWAYLRSTSPQQTREAA